MAEGAKANHKEMTAGRPIPEYVFRRWIDRKGWEANFDPSTQGGFITENGMPVAYIRGPAWRAIKDTPDITRQDMRELKKGFEVMQYRDCRTGSEIELVIMDASGELAPACGTKSTFKDSLKARNNGMHFVSEDPFLAQLPQDLHSIGVSDELMVGQLEVNNPPTSSITEAFVTTVYALRAVAQEAEKRGWFVTPVSIIGHRAITVEDVNPDAYVLRMALDYMGWKNVRHFSGSSVQNHVESIGVRESAWALNEYQHVAPYIYALSAAAPFVDGYANPNLMQIFREDEEVQSRLNDSVTYGLLNTKGCLSARYASRWRGSPSGGTFRTPLPENIQDLYSQADALLRSGQIPNPARINGHHVDRLRIDIGTVEPSNDDTWGGNVFKLIANREFHKALFYKLQMYTHQGRESELFARFPMLFPAQVTEQTLRNAHFANLAAGFNGVEAQVLGYDGNVYTIGQLSQMLVTFASEKMVDAKSGAVIFEGLNAGVVEELQRSMHVPVTEDYSNYTDESGIVSMRGYYESGVGTAAHWMKERVRQLMDRGVGEKDAIVDCMKDMGQSYHRFLAGLQVEDMARFI